MSMFDRTDCGADDSPLVWENGRRQLRVVVEWFQRRTMLGWQRPCPRCGADIGQPCTRPSGDPLRYISSSDDGHHTERVPDMPRKGWATR